MKKYIYYFSVICIIFSGCAAQDNSDFPSYKSDNVELTSILSDTTDCDETLSYSSKSNTYSGYDTTTASSDFEHTNLYNDFGTPVGGLDLNYDGFQEDFFLGKDEFGDDEYVIVMYDNDKGTFCNIQIPRTENIDIYRENYSQSDEPSDYRYWFTYISGNVNKQIEYSPVYTGSQNDKTLAPHVMGYYKRLAPYIKYERIDEKGFYELMNDPDSFLKKVCNFEFVDRISLEDNFNADCKQTYVGDIAVNDEMPKIQVYSLENDLFGKKYKLTNGKFSYFTDEFDLIELFERCADEPTTADKEYDIVSQDEKDYLICLSNPKENKAVFLYLGTSEEGYLFKYGAENTSSRTAYLEKDGWIFAKQIEIAE